MSAVRYPTRSREPALECRVLGSGFGFEGVGFRVQGSRFRFRV